MKAKELREFSATDLQSRLGQWQEEVFRSRFKMENAEARDTSVIRKLRRNIARAYTILGQKQALATTEANAPVDRPTKAKASAKPKSAAKSKATKASE